MSNHTEIDKCIKAESPAHDITIIQIKMGMPALVGEGQNDIPTHLFTI